MADFSLLLTLGTVSSYHKDQTVFSQNDSGDCMYIILNGEFGVYINSITGFPLRYSTIEKGSFFGEMALIDGSVRSATIIAEQDSSVLVVEKENFISLLNNAPDLAQEIMDALRVRYATTAEAVRKSGKEAPELTTFLQRVKFRDTDSSIVYMESLARHLRDMNDLLTNQKDDYDTADMSTEAKEKAAEDIVELLPSIYTLFYKTDKNDNGKYLQKQQVSCPYCDENFFTTIPVVSALRQKETTLLGRIIYEDFDILLYTNLVCTNCNYTDAFQEFGRPFPKDAESLIDGNKFKNKEGFVGYENDFTHNLDEAVLSYYQNINCLSRTTSDPLRFGKAWIRLYWIYSDNKRSSLAHEAAEQAYKYYLEYMEANRNSLDDWSAIRIYAILGELAVASGDIAAAKEHYIKNNAVSKSIDKDFIKQSQKRLKEIKKM